MGLLIYPEKSVIYLDTNCIIYSVEKIEPYNSLLTPLWQRAKAGDLRLTTSHLNVMETLISPLKTGDGVLQDIYKELLLHSREFELIPINMDILELAASLRALTSIKTPDAIHAASALWTNCDFFVTHDSSFTKVPELSVSFLE